MYPWCSFVFVILLQAVENNGSPTWPYGQYTLLKPKTGCPDGWHDKGYLYQDTIDKNPSNNRSETLHIDGHVGISHVKRYFCSKTDKAGTLWPSGKYCIYRHKNERLHGMRKGSIIMYGEKKNNEDKHQSIKFFVLIKKSFLGSTYQYTRLYFTCQKRGNQKIPISLPITKPFYLLPYGSRECQQVKWMVATSEWIKYHTRNYVNYRHDQKSGTVPYHELGDRNNKGITMYYCYYEGCNYTLTDKKGVFQSPGFPGKYPDGQLCSWRIMVPDNHTLHVHFTNFSLSVNDTLRYSKRINDSWYTIPLSMEPCVTLSSASDVRFVFHSDERNTSTGFRAEYRVFMPKEAIKGSSFSSTNKEIIVIVVPVVCLLVGVVLLIVIIYQCRYKERADRSVINPTYESGAIFLTSPTETATTNIALNGGDDSRTYQNVSCGTLTYEDIEWGKLNKKADPNRNRKNSKAKKSDSVKDSEQNPLYHVSELHDPKTRACQSQLEMRESEAVKNSSSNPLYHVLERPEDNNEDQPKSESEEIAVVKDGGPNPLYHGRGGPDPNNDQPEDQFDPKFREPEHVKDYGPSPLYHVLEGPDPNNEPDEKRSTLRSTETEVVKDSDSNPLYHVLEEPDPDNAALEEDQIYEDVD